MESSTHSTDPTIEPIDWRDVNERAAEKNYADESASRMNIMKV